MSYTPLNLQDGTKVTGVHVSHIEDGIVSNESDITALNQSLAYKTDTTYYSDSVSVSSMLSDWGTKTNRMANTIVCYGDTAKFLTNSSTNGMWCGLEYRNSATYGYFLYSYGSTYMYVGRIADGEITTLNRITLENMQLTSASPTAENSAD